MARLPLNALQVFQLLRFATTLSIGILLAKFFRLPTEEIATYEILLFLANFLSFFWIGGVQKTLLSQYHRASISADALIIKLVVLLLVLGIVAGGLLYIFSDYLVATLTQYEQLPYLGYVSLYLLLDSPTTLIEFLYLLRKEDRLIIRYGIILFFLRLCVVLIPLSLGCSLEWIFLSLVGWSVFKICWLGYLIKKSFGNLLRKLADWGQWQLILYSVLPLSLHGLLGGGMEYVDGWIVSSYFSEVEQFAIFRYGARELPLVTILTAALVATLIPKMVENQELSLQEMRQSIDRLSDWLFPVSIVLVGISPYLFPVVYNEDFRESATVFNIYLLIISSRILLPQVIIYAHQHNSVLVYSAIVELVVNLFLSIYFVRRFGLPGIAFATVIAYWINKIILIMYNYRTFNIPFTAYLSIKKYLIYNFLLLLAFYYAY